MYFSQFWPFRYVWDWFLFLFHWMNIFQMKLGRIFGCSLGCPSRCSLSCPFCCFLRILSNIFYQKPKWTRTHFFRIFTLHSALTEKKKCIFHELSLDLVDNQYRFVDKHSYKHPFDIGLFSIWRNLMVNSYKMHL